MVNKWFRSLTIVGLSLVVISCSATMNKRSFGEVIDDAVISNKLKVKYLKDKQVKAFKINVDTWKGIVKLRGKVEVEEQIDRAIEIAERQKGVREVRSYLVVMTAAELKQIQLAKKRNRVIQEVDIKPASQKSPHNKIVKAPTKITGETKTSSSDYDYIEVSADDLDAPSTVTSP